MAQTDSQEKFESTTTVIFIQIQFSSKKHKKVAKKTSKD
jgi:hypothetical protein